MDALEDKQIEEMHAAKYKQNQPDLVRQCFDALLRIRDHAANFQSECDVAKIYQIKADD